MKIVVMHDEEYIFVGSIKPFVETKSDFVKFAMFFAVNFFPIFHTYRLRIIYKRSICAAHLGL